MFPQLKKIIPVTLIVAFILGGIFGNTRPISAAVVLDEAAGTYTDDFADATGIAASSGAGVNAGAVQLKNAGGTYTAPYVASGSVTLNVFRPLRVAAFQTLSIVATTPLGTSIKAQVGDDGGALYRDAYLPGNSTGISSFPIDLSEVPFLQCGDFYEHGVPPPYVDSCVKIGAITITLVLETTDPSATPVIDSVNLTWITSRGGVASPLADAPWPLISGNKQGSYLSSYGNAAQYPAFRWAGPQHEGAYGLGSSNGMLALDDAIIFGSFYYPASMVSADTADGSVNWQLPFFGDVHSGVITQDGTFYGTDIGTDLFYAIDVATGQVKWTYNFYGGHGNGHVVVNGDGSRIYTIRNNSALINTVYVFGPDGTLITTNAITTPAGVAANPTKMVVSPIDGTLYFGTNVRGAGNASTDTGKLYALDPADGTVLWSYDVGDVDTYSGPMVGPDGTIYVPKSFYNRNFPVQLVAINPGVAPAERVKWTRNFGTGDMGIRQVALRSDGNLFIKYHLNPETLVRIMSINSVDGTDMAATANVEDIWEPVVSLDGGGLISHGTLWDDPADYQEHIIAYDAGLDFKWMINYAYDSLGDTVYYGISRPVIGVNDRIYSSIGKTVYSGPDEVVSEEHLELFALAPWTLTPSVNAGAIYRDSTVTFSVTTSMQQTNPITSEANKLQVVLADNTKIPLVYSSTNGSGDTIWTAAYSVPSDAAFGVHNYTVQANQALVKTDIVTAFTSPATGSDNTGLTAAGTYTIARNGTSGGGGAMVSTPDIAVRTPAAGAAYAPGTTVGLEWTPTNGAFTKYKVSYSANNGTAWASINDNVTSNSLSWIVPVGGTTQGKIKVEGYDQSGSLLATGNSANFTVTGAAAAQQPGGATPNGYDPAFELANTPDINADRNLPLAPPFTAWCVSGTLIKTESSPSVYYCGADGKRYVFVNDKAFFSWYSDFSQVQTIADFIMSNIPIGGNVTYRPGARMIKIQSDPKVYAVARGGILRWIATEAVAIRLYGPAWNTMIDDVPDSFFVNYAVGAPIME